MQSIKKIKKDIDDNNLAFFILLEQLSTVYENKLKYPDVKKYNNEYEQTINFIKNNISKIESIKRDLLNKNKEIADNVKTADIKINQYKKTNSIMQNDINNSEDQILTSNSLFENHMKIYNNNRISTYIFGALSFGIIALFAKEIYQINNNNL